MKNSTLYLVIGYLVVLILGFLGAPKQPAYIVVIAWLIYTALYVLGVWFVKTKIIVKK